MFQGIRGRVFFAFAAGIIATQLASGLFQFEDIQVAIVIGIAVGLVMLWLTSPRPMPPPAQTLQRADIMRKGLRPALEKADADQSCRRHLTRHPPDKWPQPQLAVLIDWHGPFPSTRRASKWAAQSELSGGLYVSVGHRTWLQRLGGVRAVTIDIGISEDRLPQRLKEKAREWASYSVRDIWVGEVVSQPGEFLAPNERGPLSQIEITEWLLIHFSRPIKNRERMQDTPRQSAVLRNRWYSRRGILGWRHIPKMVPDIIAFDGPMRPAQLIWIQAKGEPVRSVTVPPPHTGRIQDIG